MHRYPALWVRIQHRFGPRVPEWVLAVIMALWGALLLTYGGTFSPEAYAAIGAIFGSGKTLGSIMVVFGVLRLCGLIVNGMMPRTTPWIRVVSAGVGFLVFVLISTAFFLSVGVKTWAAVYPVFAVLELLNIYRAAQDAGDRNGSPT